MSRRAPFLAMLLALLTGSAGAQQFSFDSGGRLVEVRYDGSHSIRYRYDEGDNLTNVIVTASLAETDIDGDAMPDAWELVYFNNTTNSAAGDFNRDTVSNLRHYQDGTDPTNPDTDGDHQSNVDELLAGTSPTNADSCLQMESLARTNAAGVVVGWQSVTGRSYRLVRASHVVTGQWSMVVGSITGVPPQNVYTDSAGGGPYHYRVELE